ncbi:MAG: UvrB/UvrC motif-containing protein [Armatimonadota bacterium]
MDTDISPILDAWEYDSGQVVVRQITGVDGKPKLQLRLDLGVLQMELDGRPDGQRPHGEESLLEYYVAQLQEHSAKYGTDAGFTLSPDDCYDLQEEALQYYHRYVSLLAVGDYARAERDTARNLRVFDLVFKHAKHQSDKYVLERSRPYVILMNTRARALASLEEGNRNRAIRRIRQGMELIKQSFGDCDEGKPEDRSAELAFLGAWLRDVKERHPPGPEEQLREELQWAVDVEDYQRAAQIRNEIRKLETPED